MSDTNNMLVSPMELPVAETEEVDVLVVENEELKRKPVEGLGGQETPDLVVTLTGMVQDKNLSVTHGSVSAIADKLKANKRPIIKIIHEGGVYGDRYHYRNEFDAAVATYGESYWFVAIIGNATGPGLYKLSFGIDANHNFTWSNVDSIG